MSSASGRSLICGACLSRRPRFDASFCPFRYAYPLDHLVRGIKYHRALAHGRVLSELLASRLQSLHRGAQPGILLPVPLAPRRYRERGYNQATELARCVEKRMQIRMHTDLVVRSRETPEQATLNRSQRRKNIRGAFTLVRKLPARHIAIIDDVITTGSTVNELAKVLKRAGAQRVEVWAVARAGRK
ncbi:MAG TPA: ComF family protein [Steroidobacteraceae bacterium]